jgi:hypothetical protein
MSKRFYTEKNETILSAGIGLTAVVFDTTLLRKIVSGLAAGNNLIPIPSVFIPVFHT